MKMSVRVSLLFVILAVTLCSSGASSMCKRTLTKRLLKMIGVDPHKTPCMINTRRDMARFIDTAIDDIRERAFLEDEEIDIDKAWPLAKRGYGQYDGQYCCSPTCDRYMAHMNIKPKFVEC
ncbi:uncharacterized protein LOC135692549 [Rhopilema esculentum]|uniref:uncharacterized protein LOC135692549 n=1 Tax=Rhopilema esculentum TaxID=499914 RepID=UPI0031D13759